MSEILTGLAAPIGVLLLTFGWGLFMKPKKVKGWGIALGRLASGFGQKRIGRKNWEKVEKKFQGTLSDFIDGVQEGLNEDDDI